MQIHTLPLGSYQTNCYILCNGADCLIIDPGYEARAILSFMEKQGLIPGAILLTHGHFDHVGAVKELAAETGCRVFLCDQDLSMPPMMTAGPLFYTDTYAEGDCLTLAGMSFRVLHTPGHTPGSVCLLFENALFCGDTLFAGSCGRTDLPGGSTAALRASLQRLASLEGDCTVYPGHGEATTLDYERNTNPYL